MTDSPSSAPKKRFTRRGMFKAAAAATGGYLLWNYSSIHELGDLSHPPTQEQVNQLYAMLYDKIETAKATAEKEGKKLTVLIGESHVHNDSLLLNLMIIDIGIKLGINNYVPEGIWNEEEAGMANEAAKTWPQASEDERLKALAQSLFMYNQRVGNARVNLRAKTFLWKGLSGIQHLDCSAMYAITYGMNIAPGSIGTDVTHYINYESAAREQSIIETVKNTAGNKICQYGVAHLDRFNEALKSHDHVLAINTANVATANERTNKMALVVEGVEVVPKQIFEFLRIASAKHDMDKEGIDHEVQEQEINRLQLKVNAIWAECAKQKSAHER